MIKKKKSHYDISFYEILNILVYDCKYWRNCRKIWRKNSAEDFSVISGVIVKLSLIRTANRRSKKCHRLHESWLIED